MESNSAPNASEAAAALADADAAADTLAGQVVVPAASLLALGTAVAVQIGTAAAGISGEGPLWLLVTGVLVFLAVAGAVAWRFRSLNGVWLGGFLSRVVGGTEPAASIAYGLGLAGAVWAAFATNWWLVGLGSVLGGAGYAASGLHWLRQYRSAPAAHSRGESAAWLALMGVVGLAGLVLLVASS